MTNITILSLIGILVFSLGSLYNFYIAGRSLLEFVRTGDMDSTRSKSLWYGILSGLLALGAAYYAFLTVRLTWK